MLARLVSRHLTSEEIKAATNSLPDVLLSIASDAVLRVMYGWGCRPSDITYAKSMKMGVEAFRYFLEDSCNQRIFTPGKSDLLSRRWV